MSELNNSRTVRAGKNTYFFDLKETKRGKQYVVITESRFKGEEEGHERVSIAIFPETARDFLEAAQDMLTRLQ